MKKSEKIFWASFLVGMGYIGLKGRLPTNNNYKDKLSKVINITLLSWTQTIVLIIHIPVRLMIYLFLADIQWYNPLYFSKIYNSQITQGNHNSRNEKGDSRRDDGRRWHATDVLISGLSLHIFSRRIHQRQGDQLHGTTQIYQTQVYRNWAHWKKIPRY